MRREQVELGGDGPRGTVIAYGHCGRPVLVFPAEAGRAWDLEDNGLVGAVADLVDAGRVKLYCVDSFDAWTWSDRGVADRGARPAARGVRVVDLRPRRAVGLGRFRRRAASSPRVGCSLGAFHAANFALKRADVFPLALCFSGNYDPTTWHGWGERGEATYFNNPFDYVAGLRGDHLEWLRRQVSLLLVVGQGAFEVSPTAALPSTRAFADLLATQGHPARARRVGRRRPARLGLVATPARPPPATVLLTPVSCGHDERGLR